MRIKTSETIMWLIGLTYLLHCMMIISESDVLKGGLYLVQMALFVCCVKYIRQYKNNLVWIYFLFFTFYLFLGILNGNHPSYLVADLFSFALLVTVFLYRTDNRDDFTNQLINSVSLLLIIGCIFAVYFFITNGLQPATSIGERLLIDNVQEGGFLKTAMEMIQVSVVLLPFFWHLDFKRRIILASTLLIFFGVSVFMLSRANIATTLVSVLITIYLGFRQKFIRFNFSSITLIASIMLGFTALYYIYGDIIDALYTLASLRFEEIGGDNIEPRDLEAEVYFSRASIYEIWVGKGLGGVNNFPFGRYSERGLMMLHRGENNLILKGGIPLLVLLYGAALVSLIKLLRSKAVYSAPWAAVIFLFLMLERGHQQYSQFFMLLFFCLAISYGFNTKMDQAKVRQK